MLRAARADFFAVTPGDEIGAREVLFYDGYCGLCHRAVRFVLARDPAGDRFCFAPLGGELFRALVGESERAGLPDSLVLRAVGGALLPRSAAVLHILRRLGGLWAIAAFLARLVPAAVWDTLYDSIARVRYRLFARPPGTCPVVPAHLRSRFLA